MKKKSPQSDLHEGKETEMKADIKENKLASEVEAARNRLADLYVRSAMSPLPQPLVDEALAELSIALEELRASVDQVTTSRQEVEAQRQRYLELFEFAPAGYLITDPSGNIREANKVAATMLNCRQDYLVGKPMVTFLMEESHTNFFQLLNRLVKEDMDGEWWFPLNPREKVRSFPAALSVSRMFDGQGYAGLRWLLRDITEHKKAEKQSKSNLERISALRDINVAITSSLDLQTVLGLLLEKLEHFISYSTATTVRLLDRETRELEYLLCRNIEQTDWKGYGRHSPGPRAEEVIRTKAPLVVRDVQTDPRSVRRPELYSRNSLVSYLAVPLIIKEEVIGILCLYAKEEHEFSVEEIEFLSSLAAQAAIAIHNSRLYEQLKRQAIELEKSHLELEERVRERTSQLGAVNQALKAEIAERRQVEEKLRDREAQLSSLAKELEQQLIASDRLVSMGELAASIAHEFNNPLQIILGYIQDFLSEMKPSHPDHQALTIVEKETLRCSEIIQNLLDFARPANADLALLDIETIIRNSIQVVMGHLVNSQIKVTMDIQPNLPLISADGNQLVQVLINLFFNAAEAMPGGGTLTVRATALFPDQATEEKLMIAVSDTGIGIEPEAMANIFRPFFTTKKKKGMGLGLSICERIIKAHGGEIKVESTCGSGTTFYLHFPLIKTTDYGSAA
ncbi:MAG TPA: ATP-binding protein [Candidatus Binatia bacterium]|jgi:PAS domain S-box-containing protein|nr:ATP-binding protein [Candidatus Binatia bacterium]